MQEHQLSGFAYRQSCVCLCLHVCVLCVQLWSENERWERPRGDRLAGGKVGSPSTNQLVDSFKPKCVKLDFVFSFILLSVMNLEFHKLMECSSLRSVA